jgi:hypothetical protein
MVMTKVDQRQKKMMDRCRFFDADEAANLHAHPSTRRWGNRMLTQEAFGAHSLW